MERERQKVHSDQWQRRLMKQQKGYCAGLYMHVIQDRSKQQLERNIIADEAHKTKRLNSCRSCCNGESAKVLVYTCRICLKNLLFCTFSHFCGCYILNINYYTIVPYIIMGMAVIQEIPQTLHNIYIFGCQDICVRSNSAIYI